MKKDDVKHVSWLFKSMIANFLKGNFKDSKEAYYFIKIHCKYKSKKI